MNRTILRGAQVITMAPDRPDVDRVDILIEGDCIAARALNLWPAHDPVAAALHASIANIEAVMIPGRWRKRNHSLVETDLDTMKNRLLESSERLLHGDHRC